MSSDESSKSTSQDLKVVWVVANSHPSFWLSVGTKKNGQQFYRRLPSCPIGLEGNKNRHKSYILLSMYSFISLWSFNSHGCEGSKNGSKQQGFMSEYNASAHTLYILLRFSAIPCKTENSCIPVELVLMMSCLERVLLCSLYSLYGTYFNT